MSAAGAVRGEVLLAVLLVIRHRALRLAAVLALVVVVLTVLAGPEAGVAARRQAVFVVGGSLAAVAGSRLLAPGPALAAARLAAGPWWLAPLGRLIGAWLVVAPPVAVAAAVLVGSVAGPWDAARIVAVGAAHGAAIASFVQALGPLGGAGVAAGLGLAAAWMGGVPPSEMAAALADWPYVQAPVVAAWNVLPLDWRATRWVRAGIPADLAILLGWIGLGCLVAAWASGRAFRAPFPPSPTES